MAECTGSAVEYWTRGPREADSKLTGDTELCPWARHFILSLIVVQPKKTGNRPNITDNLLSDM